MTTIAGISVRYTAIKNTAMTKIEALKILEAMPEDSFQVFFKSLPSRVQLIVKGGLADWREVLPEWYIKLNNKE